MASMVSELVEITPAEGDPEAHRFDPGELKQVVNEIVSDEGLEAELHECSLRLLVACAVNRQR